MLTSNRQIFREESLERLSSPEDLDQLMKVISPQRLLPLAAAGLITITGGAWSILGRIPITIEGQGILIYPNSIVPLQIKNSGQLSSLGIKANDFVKKGQVIGMIDQSILEKQLQQKKSRLKELENQNIANNTLQQQSISQEKQAIAQERQNASIRIQELQSIAPILRVKSQQSIQQQRLQSQQKIAGIRTISPILKQKGRAALQQQQFSLQNQIQVAQNQIPILRSRAASFKQLYIKERAITQEVFLRTEQEYQKKQEEIAQLNTQLKEIEVKENDIEERNINNQNEIAKSSAELQKLKLEDINTQETYLRNQNEIAKLQADLKNLSRREANQYKQNWQDSTIRNNQVTELQREITQLETQINNSSEIISQQNGRILNITQSLGQVVTAGSRLATIEVETPGKSLSSITYFSVAEGKKIQPNMSIQITPQTFKRESFGGIIGKVTTVSSFPITSENAAHEIGNSELANTIAKKHEGLIQVSAKLLTDPKTPSGYQWSSSLGPPAEISSGTTTTVRVKIEERAPITFLLPILRSISGLD